MMTGKSVAVKIESTEARHPQLYHEYALYSRYLKGETGFPKVLHFAHTRELNYMVMSLLGHNLEYLLEACNGKFSLKTLRMLSIQLVERLHTLHQKTGYLHRDIKPENLLMGRKKHKSTLYMADLGLAKLFIERKGRKHIEETRRRRSLTGTARYASVNAHHGKDQSRRDDMESALYVLVYLGKGRLPWQGIKGINKFHTYEKVCEAKARISTKDLCQGLPPEYHLFADYVRCLKFKERPKYEDFIGRKGLFQNSAWCCLKLFAQCRYVHGGPATRW